MSCTHNRLAFFLIKIIFVNQKISDGKYCQPIASADWILLTEHARISTDVSKPRTETYHEAAARYFNPQGVNSTVAVAATNDRTKFAVLNTCVLSCRSNVRPLQFYRLWGLGAAIVLDVQYIMHIPSSNILRSPRSALPVHLCGPNVLEWKL